MKGMVKMSSRETTHIRVYKKDLLQVRNLFPDVRMADFFHMSTKTNPFIQVEAVMRGSKVNVKKK